MIKIKNCALYGGTFDPFHLGHLYLINWLLKSGRFDRVIVIPAGAPWQRETQASPAERLEMTRLALTELIDSGQVEISDTEIVRHGKSYAIDTVQELAIGYPAEHFTWVIGSDAFATIESWQRIEELAGILEFLVISRPGVAIKQPPKFITWQSADIDALDISATRIRELLRAKESIADLVPEKVAAFIRDNGLYGAS